MHVTPGGGVAPMRRSTLKRSAALVATFLLLVAGVVVSAPGLMSASAGSTSDSVHGDDGDHDGDDNDGHHDDGDDHEGHHHGDDECEQEDHEGHHDDGDHDADDDGHHDDGDHDADDAGHHDDGDHDADDDDNCAPATIAVEKSVVNGHGGLLTPGDFQLLVDGQPQEQLIAVPATEGVVHTISEIQQPGYAQTAIACTDSDSGVAVSDDGTVTLAAGQHVSCVVTNQDGAPTVTVHKAVHNDNGGAAQPQDFQLTFNGDAAVQGSPLQVMANEPSVISEVHASGYAPIEVTCTSDVAGSPNARTLANTATIGVTPVLGEHVDCTITNDDVAPGLTVVKAVVNDDGGNQQITDFPLQVNGATVESGANIESTAGVALVITETQRTGYLATDLTCVSSDPQSPNNMSIPDPPAILATVSLAVGEALVCTVTNDDVAPTVTVHKTVVGGTKVAADFQMTVRGAPQAQDVPVATLANTSVEVSEVADPQYVTTSVTCVDNAGGAPLAHPLLLDEGQNATCTVVNTFDSPTITVIKDVVNAWGGTLQSGDFELRIDGVGVAQGVPQTVVAGVHAIGELARAGYAQTAIDCVDLASDQPVGEAGSVNLAAGEDVECTVSNADVPATLTLTKQLVLDDGGTAVPSDFQLLIDDTDAPQGEPVDVSSGAHTIGEVAVDAYRLVGIVCTDDDTQEVLVYDAGIALALGQHVSCALTNDDDPIDLSITKSDAGAVEVAGGAAFDYTITVDNVGPRDAAAGEAVTVTDRLPAGLAFVSFPANCSAADQVLTCAMDPADLQVADPAVVLTVTVKALADADSGVHTNIAYVDTAEDPACVGAGCVPVCGADTNNVACASTTIRREASLTIDKTDNVETSIRPGDAFAYFITVKNAGPSTFLANLAVADDLPAGLQLISTSAAAPWSCNTSDPVSCTLESVLQPNTTAPVITIDVRLDPAFVAGSILNEAKAIAIVDPPVPVAAAQLRAEATSPPGTVVTAIDDETTIVNRQADVSIAKSASVATVPAGDDFNWVLDITNHGPDTATNVVVSDSIPVQFEVVGTFPTAGLSCTSTTSTVQCTAAMLANGATVSAVINVRALAAAPPGVVVNTATVTSETSDPAIGDNTDSASVEVTAARSSAPIPPSTPGGVPTLPATGNAPLDGPLTMAALLVLCGAVSSVVGRRRRSRTA